VRDDNLVVRAAARVAIDHDGLRRGPIVDNQLVTDALEPDRSSGRAVSIEPGELHQGEPRTSTSPARAVITNHPRIAGTRPMVNGRVGHIGDRAALDQRIRATLQRNKVTAAIARAVADNDVGCADKLDDVAITRATIAAVGAPRMTRCRS
jgi:hypothetical protein